MSRDVPSSTGAVFTSCTLSYIAMCLWYLFWFSLRTSSAFGLLSYCDHLFYVQSLIYLSIYTLLYQYFCEGFIMHLLSYKVHVMFWDISVSSRFSPSPVSLWIMDCPGLMLPAGALSSVWTPDAASRITLNNLNVSVYARVSCLDSLHVMYCKFEWLC